MRAELRPPTEADADRIVGLVRACDLDEIGEPDYDREALDAEWAEPGVELARDAVVAVDPGGDIAGYSLLLGHDIRAWTLPARRGEGIGTAVREHAEAAAAARGLTEVRQQITGANEPARALLTRAGYALHAHHWRMRTDLRPEHRAAPAPPDGVGLRAFRPGEDDRTAYELIAGAFTDIHGQEERPFAAWSAAARDQDLWLIAELDGVPAGALVAEAREGRTGHVAELGVRREARRRGVAGALLRHAFAAFTARGLVEAALTARTHNLAGVRLYESLGMAADWRIDELAKPL